MRDGPEQHSHLHVSCSGNDSNPGTEAAPLRTIGQAARLARPGDVITVHEGIYRERVDPPRGGLSDALRIVFEAAPGERVEIRGSEIVSGWIRDEGDVWTVKLPDSFFEAVNPFREELGGDWFWGEDRAHHTADVYLDGRSLFEAADLPAVRQPVRQSGAADPDASLRAWYAAWHDGQTRVWANFGGIDPNRSLVEVNVRPACFLPRQSGIDFITVRGFRMGHAATQWAPPTADQPGLIGPHWSKGWIIEDNVIHDSRCSGISLGTNGDLGQNEWTRLRVKHGTQRQREVVFRALQAGWDRDTVGSHVVRNNTIHNCEQTGICGNLGAIFSEISGNHIFDIHVKNQFNGAEIAGIKLHAPIDVILRGNHVHHAARGMWMDWQAQGTRITGNVLYANSSEDLFLEVTHGPCVVDNNVLLSPVSVRNLAQGTAFAHNLLAGRVELERVLVRYTPYHRPHSTAVAGLMTVQGGDDRWFNNLFTGPVAGDLARVVGDQIEIGDAQLEAHPSASSGLSAYDGYPVPSDDWCTGLFVGEYLEHRLPVWIAGNAYAATEHPYQRESDALVLGPGECTVHLEAHEGTVVVDLRVAHEGRWDACRPVTADRLGAAFEPEVPYENPDGSPIQISTDFFGAARGASPCAGPFEGLAPGRHRVVLSPGRSTE